MKTKTTETRKRNGKMNIRPPKIQYNKSNMSKLRCEKVKKKKKQVAGKRMKKMMMKVK